MLVNLYVRSLVTRWKCERAGEVVSNLTDEQLKDKAPKEKNLGGSECLMVNHFL